MARARTRRWRCSSGCPTWLPAASLEEPGSASTVDVSQQLGHHKAKPSSTSQFPVPSMAWEKTGKTWGKTGKTWEKTRENLPAFGRGSKPPPRSCAQHPAVLMLVEVRSISSAGPKRRCPELFLPSWPSSKPESWPWFAGSRCTHPSHVQGGGTSGQVVLGVAEGTPQYSLHAPNGPPSLPASSAAAKAPRQPTSPAEGGPAAPSETPRHGCAQVGDATVQCRVCPPPRERAFSPSAAELGGPWSPPELATDGWRQLADACPSSPALPFLLCSFCSISRHFGGGRRVPLCCSPRSKGTSPGSWTRGQKDAEGTRWPRGTPWGGG